VRDYVPPTLPSDGEGANAPSTGSNEGWMTTTVPEACGRSGHPCRLARRPPLPARTAGRGPGPIWTRVRPPNGHGRRPIRPAMPCQFRVPITPEPIGIPSDVVQRCRILSSKSAALACFGVGRTFVSRRGSIEFGRFGVCPPCSRKLTGYTGEFRQRCPHWKELGRANGARSGLRRAYPAAGLPTQCCSPGG